MGLGAAARRLRAARRPDVRHGVRGLGRGRRAFRQRGLRLLEALPARGPHHPRQQARQLLGDGRDGSLRPLLRDPLRPARRGGDRRMPGPRDGQYGPSPGDRDMEPGVHAVQPQGQRFARTAAGAQRRYGHGLRASVHDSPGQEIELRHRRVPARDRTHRGDGRQALRRRREGRRGHARDRRPPARHFILDRRRPAALERQGGLCYPPHPAPRRALRLHLPGLQRAVPLPSGGGPRGADGGAVPRAESAAGADREGDRGGGVGIPAHAGHGHQPARRRDRTSARGGRQPHRRSRRVPALRHLRIPHRPHGAHRPRTGR